MNFGVRKALDDVFGYLATHTRTLTGGQCSKLSRAQCTASAIGLECSISLVAGSAVFVSINTPTIGNLVKYSHKVWTCFPKKQINPNQAVLVAQANLQARDSVFCKYAALETNGGYGWIAVLGFGAIEIASRASVRLRSHLGLRCD